MLSNIWAFVPLVADSSGSGWPGWPGEGWQNNIAQIATAVANGKFLALLSILFGVGMAIQFDSAKRRGHRWPWRYGWRSLLLIAYGFVHFALVVEFDVLMGYGLVALLTAPLLFLRTRWLALVTALLGAVHLYRHLSVIEWQPYQVDDYGADYAEEDWSTESAADLPPLPTPTYFDEVAGRVGEFWEIRVPIFENLPTYSGFLFLCGVLLWRAGVFTADEEARKLSRLLAMGGLGVGILMTAWGILPVPGAEALEQMSRYISAPIVAFGYLGVVLLLLRRGGGTGFVTRRLAEVGRTALTCYVLQNIIGVVAFSKWGFHIGPLDSLGTLIAWAAISALLMLFANLWLRRFRQGPFEIVWRTGVDAPFRRADRKRDQRHEPQATETVTTSPSR
ncbi:DUF418 domain-containing protein [Streptomyces ferrugineus]|uniref:DUF418 domain-containing protein n=1 Tax=Streptomyces ferrugineus TaxID=1413221 RepID=A0A7M2SCA7_9ACTN|nr:DUF418 domain-containing protein [Streptomyces ferrugineus]QOV33118.1 DUF418 domain-containing protein [Streptomyces ferrugineus]